MLDRILGHKRREVAGLKSNLDLKSLIRAVDKMDPARSLARVLAQPGRVALLAEIKKSSPSRGVIRQDFHPRDLAATYSANGADAISVLTDERFFGGHPGHLEAVKEITSLPVLRKDFIIDPVQVYQARLLGADAVLLICAVLSPADLRSMLQAVKDAGMDALVEVHDHPDLEAAAGAGAGIIGINNRDLKTFSTDLSTTLRLRPLITDPSVVVVSESGIKSAADMKKLKESGVHAALVGEALMAAGDVAAKVRELAFGQ